MNKVNKNNMEKFFGIDDIEPIKLTPSDTLDKEEKGDCFADWHEEELAEKYREYREMEVSKAYLSCLDEEATQLFKKNIESANLTPDVVRKGLELFDKLTHDESDN
ncbi:TPA: hypothetical protein N2D10_003042 [Clostridium botulinum]|nr:hypothetical protein [Clostridium botulinum]